MNRTTVLVLALATVTASAARAQQAGGEVRTVTVCTVENGQMRNTQRQYDVARGDTTTAHTGVDAPGTAAGAAWFINNEPLVLNGTRYVRTGLPRVLAPGDATRTAEYRGVPVFTEPGSGTPPAALYVHVRPGCEFQRYEAEPALGSVRG